MENNRRSENNSYSDSVYHRRLASQNGEGHGHHEHHHARSNHGGHEHGSTRITPSAHDCVSHGPDNLGKAVRPSPGGAHRPDVRHHGDIHHGANHHVNRFASSKGSEHHAHHASGDLRHASTHLKTKPIATRKKRTGYTLLISIAVFAVLLIIALAVLWKIVDTHVPSVDNGPQGGALTQDTAIVTGDPDLENPPLYANTSIERKSGFYTMLLVGHDAVAVNTDVIMLVSFDVEGGALSIMQIPRDTYIETNERARKINSVYGLMRDDKISDKSKRIASGMDGLAEVIEEGIGIPIDFWAIIDLDGFDGIIDAIGGVEMDVPCDMDYEDPEQDLYIHLKKGLQTLDGEKAEQFVRFRDSFAMGDIGRVDAQKIFMSALFNQLKENLTVSGVTKLAEKTIPLVNTDMKLLDCIYFGKNFIKGVDFEKITFVTLPGESARENGTSGLSYYVMRRSDMLQLVNAYFNPYTTELTEKSIDKLQIFNSEDNEFISKVYLAPSVGMENLIYEADDIMEDSIDIAIKGE